MNDLLEFVLGAHGGRKRWSEVKTLTTQLAVGGPLWKLREFPDALLRDRQRPVLALGRPAGRLFPRRTERFPQLAHPGGMNARNY